MDDDWADILDEVFRRRGAKLYMPVMLLAAIDCIADATATPEEISFADVEARFATLMTRYGGSTDPRAWEPFYHLASVGVWSLTRAGSPTNMNLPRPKSRGVLMNRADCAHVLQGLRPALNAQGSRRALRVEICGRLRLDGGPSAAFVIAYLPQAAETPVSPPPAEVEQAPQPYARIPQYCRPYVEAPEVVLPAQLAPVNMDPAIIERGLRAHASIQTAIAQRIRRVGQIPLSPALGGPDFDVAWCDGTVFHVVEVKSLTPENETSQLRLGLGQVLQYRTMMAPSGYSVRAVLAVERGPAVPVWSRVCSDVDVTLTWASSFRGLFLAT